MPTVRQAAEFFMKALKDGKGDLHTTHPVIVEEENKKREKGENPGADGKLPTRVAFDVADNEVYKRFHVVRHKWMKRAGGNPTLMMEGMLTLMEKLSDETIDAILDNLGEPADPTYQGPERAQILSGL